MAGELGNVTYMSQTQLNVLLSPPSHGLKRRIVDPKLSCIARLALIIISAGSNLIIVVVAPLVARFLTALSTSTRKSNNRQPIAGPAIDNPSLPSLNPSPPPSNPSIDNPSPPPSNPSIDNPSPPPSNPSIDNPSPPPSNPSIDNPSLPPSNPSIDNPSSPPSPANP
ncbi:sulfated surface glycoprotein 185-like [Mercurialis annua]|uniref:sulfated surface glycoprotein 185-like n=1 Tax=Mercurialis annua TaxID=3986 RepID=UPI00215E9FA9|nr:sulfated surface glycoprotein 185-like [Mercurialis annua]